VEWGWSVGEALGGSTARDSYGSDCDIESDGCSSGSTDESGDVSNVTGLLRRQWPWRSRRSVFHVRAQHDTRLLAPGAPIAIRGADRW